MVVVSGFSCPMAHGVIVPDQGSNPHPLLWKCRVLTNGPAEKFSHLLRCWFFSSSSFFAVVHHGILWRFFASIFIFIYLLATSSSIQDLSSQPGIELVPLAVETEP